MVESSIGIFVACLPTTQYLFRRNTRKGVSGASTTSSGGSAGISNSRGFGSTLSRNRAIQVEYTIDVAHLNKDSNPILTRADPWLHNNRSDEGSDDIELQEYVVEA